MIGSNISELLVPEDKDVFSIATQEMLADNSRTVEVIFHVVAEVAGGIKSPFEIEGKGMLMYNRVTGEPSHTMWVIKSLGGSTIKRWSRNLLENRPLLTPIATNEEEEDEEFITTPSSAPPESFSTIAAEGKKSPSLLSPAIKNVQSLAMRRAISQGGVPVSDSLEATTHLLNIPPALCNICERWVVAAFFEQHSELCAEIHRAEMDVSTCNDSLTELKHYVQGLVDYTKSEVQQLENNPLHQIVEDEQEEEEDDRASIGSKDSIFGESLPLDEDKASPLERKGAELEKYLSLLDIMNVALSIPTPGSEQDDTCPANPQAHGPSSSPRLKQSPASKSKIIQILYWRSPLADDEDMESLIHDIEMITKSKVDAVNRMQDCLEYNERTRNDFQQNVIRDSDWTEFVAHKDDCHLSQDAIQDEVQISPMDKDDNSHNNGAEQINIPIVTLPAAALSEAPKDVYTDQQKEENDEEEKCTKNTKKNIFKKIKDWKSKKGKRNNNNNKQSKKAVKQQRKSLANLQAQLPPPVKTTALAPKEAPLSAIGPKIIEMETIDTPMASPRFPAASTATMIPPPRKSSLPINQQQKVHSSGSSTPSLGKSPLSPLPAPMISTTTRSVAPSIKDFDIIKPISKGAFGSVFLAKKRVTGDYYAIKFLKKSDMIAKNQVTNVKAERMILMTQTDSPFVTKLYYTFQSKDYLYLVMEYLNGGDCSSLIKVLGSLPCDWARNYLAEVTLGLSYLHDKQIIHRYEKCENVIHFISFANKQVFLFQQRP